MRTATFVFAALWSHCRANIIFSHVELSCDKADPAYTGCLRGQHCNASGKCEVSSSHTENLQRRAYSVDGACGKQAGGLLCDPNSPNYKGTCCSIYGWCGSTDAYCGNGCQSGCNGVSPPASTPRDTFRDDGRCGRDFGGAPCDPSGPYGGCCSQYGYCGKTDGHCLPANGCQNGCAGGSGGGGGGVNPPGSSAPPPSSTSSGEPVLGTPSGGPTTGGPVTTDGTCGKAYNGVTCGNWPQGSCCSVYGYCGKTASHCGDGCQSGPCLSGGSVNAPGPAPAPANPNPGSFKTVGQSGVPAMHCALMENGRVVFLDKVENYTQIKLPNGQFAYSSEYDPAANTAVGLGYKTNAFCSGGTFLADGRLINLGGNAPLDFIDPTVGDGFDAIRYLSRSATDAGLNGQYWSEPGNKLASKRWYASAQTMPDGTIFVASGSLNGLNPAVPANNNPTWELLDSKGITNGVNVPMDILTKNQPYYMYPFIHLMKDGNLFVFVSKSSEIFNVGSKTTVKLLPDLAGDYRTYPNTGGSVLLPLSSANQYNPDIVVCGGGAYQDITSPTDPSCGRIRPLSDNPQWELESMPEGRGMVEGTLLPDGTVIWLNGCNRGAQGFLLAQDPTYEVLIYDPAKPVGQRFSTGATSTIARLYHSVAILLLDGTLLVTGSNPVEQPVLQVSAANPFVTEFRVEIYTPPYLSGDNANKRPTALAISKTTLKADGGQFTLSFNVVAGAKAATAVFYHSGFVTHSLHMGHRMINLDCSPMTAGGDGKMSMSCGAPPNNNVAPPGPYVIYVLVDGVPGVGQFVTVTT